MTDGNMPDLGPNFNAATPERRRLSRRQILHGLAAVPFCTTTALAPTSAVFGLAAAASAYCDLIVTHGGFIGAVASGGLFENKQDVKWTSQYAADRYKLEAILFEQPDGFRVLDAELRRRGWVYQHPRVPSPRRRLPDMLDA